MFLSNIWGAIKLLQDSNSNRYQEIYELKDLHQVCSICGKIGHKPDMVGQLRDYDKHLTNIFTPSFIDWFHSDCYAKKFNKHPWRNREKIRAKLQAKRELLNAR